MTWKKKTATAASALLFAVGGTMVTAQPAAAAPSCPVNRLCIYDKPNFSGERIATGRTNSCFQMGDFAFGAIKSYRNNLSVDGIVWHVDGPGFYYARALPSGGFSSDIGISGLGGLGWDKVCMGGARP